MKILFVTHYGELYGANLSMCNVVREINKKEENQAEILSLSTFCPELEEWCNENNIKLYKKQFYNTTYSINDGIVGYIKSYGKFKINKIKVRCIDNMIKTEKYDIIHSNTMATLVGAMIAKRNSIKHIWHIREFMEEDYGIHQLNCKEANKLIEYTNLFIAISSSIKNKYKKKLPKDKIKLIYNGVPNNSIARIPHKKVIFVVLGVIRKEKGTLEAVKAFKDAISKANNKNAELWIIGGDLNSEDEYIKKVIFESNNTDGIIKLFGYKKNVNKYLAQADVGIVCSEKEAFGRVTIEFLQNGLFIIGTNSGGTKEIINKSEYGMLYMPGEYEKMSKCISYCLEHKECINANADSRMMRANDFTIERCAREIMRVY